MPTALSQTVEEFRDDVHSWILAYQRTIEPGAVRFGLISRRFARASIKFGRKLEALLRDDPRFSFAMVKGGALVVSLVTPGAQLSVEEARALARRLLSEED
jgi:hypothetical protein